RNPRWFFVVGVLLGVAMASKYTMLAAIIPIAAYCVIYCRNNQRSIPLKHIVLTIGCFLATLIIVDPAVWANPIGRLSNSFGFQLHHADSGHNVFWFGHIWTHTPPGLGIVIVLAKMSLFITLPALAVTSTDIIRAVKQK